MTIKPNGKGRPLSIEDVQAMLPKRNGQPKSRWWITHCFAPEHKKKLGRDCWWWEADVLAWLDRQDAA